MDAREKFEKFKANFDEDFDIDFQYSDFLMSDLTLDERLSNPDIVEEALKEMGMGYSSLENEGGSQFGTANRELAELFLKYGDVGSDGGIDLDAEFKVAAEAHNIPVMKLLYHRGCSIGGEGDMKDSALHASARVGDHELSKILINDFGIDPLLKNAEGRTPYDIAMDRELCQAAARGDLETVNQLIDEGYPSQAAINEYRGEGYYYGSFEYGVPDSPLYRERPADDIEPAWKIALDSGHVDVFMALIDRVGPNDYFLNDSQEHNSALRCAMEMGDTGVTIELLEQGANMHSLSQEFHLAVSQADTTLSEKMLSLGADVHRKLDVLTDDPKNRYFLTPIAEGFTPLHCAGSAEQVRLLIQHGADIHSEAMGARIVRKEDDELIHFHPKGITPLHSANSPEVALELLNAGANSNAIVPSTMNEIHQNPSLSHRISGREDIADAIDSFVQKQELLTQLTNTAELKDEQPRMRRRM
ncbi:ankyrin repeat domain-containing protein [Stenotrophomonas sp. S39]|uniref:ankyrin repeat domain-containing protein n=1 Tax=Stenotrophomonas sp. S39 TaxID=2767451 RepID=UPI00190A2397|nr:ankyrin repeat domain-containing protein [Stenotrophomonas sp. S39]MBK0052942.1 hypothetical protein [Stenotrophomonas sp. S39]